MSHCSVPAGCPFCLEGAHAASASCKHLPPSAYPSTSLWKSLDLSASLCSPAHLGGQREVSGQLAASRSSCSLFWEAAKSEEAGLAGGSAHSVCSEAICVLCPICFFFFKYVARGSSAAHLELQIFLQCSSILTVLLTAGTESTQLGGVPRCSDNIKIYLFIKRTFFII